MRLYRHIIHKNDWQTKPDLMEVVPDLWRRRRQRQQRKRPRRIHPHAPNMSQTHPSGGPRQATWLDLFTTYAANTIASALWRYDFRTQYDEAYV